MKVSELSIMAGKTRKRRKAQCAAIAVVDMNGVVGTARFYHTGQNKVRVVYAFSGLTRGMHGFHIHQYGDLSEGCKNACAHFDPSGSTHGGPRAKRRHAGDMGNISANSRGEAKGSINLLGISVLPCSKLSVIGRSIVIHESRDDLGKGKNAESLKTGNAGRRLACAVIGLASP